jgi:hypothetical protein
LPEKEKTLFEETNAGAIADFLKRIDIVDEQSGLECKCCGEPTIEFYEKDRLMAMVGVHHGRSLRWSAGWPGDGLMADAFAEYVCDWLAQHDIREPRKERGPIPELKAAINRRRTMVALKGIGGDAARDALRKCFAGQIKVRSIPAGEEDEPGGAVVYTGRDGEFSQDVSDAACAALVLAEMGDREILPELRKRAAGAAGEEKAILEKALGKFPQ